MATRMWSATYAGAARGPAELRLRVLGRDGSAARGLLCVIDGAGGLHLLDTIGDDAEWRLAVGAGPVLTLQTSKGPMTLAPTRAATAARPAGFRLALVAAAADPQEPVLVSLRRERDVLTAVGPNDAGGVVADTMIEPAGKAFDLYLEA
jgi:hypothetical protein